MSTYPNHRDRNTGRILVAFGVVLLLAGLAGLLGVWL
jgi:hypothetical protein